MTKTTEELKREMYKALADFKCRKCINGVILPIFDDLDSALEAYLEALRQDLNTSHEATGELAIQLSEMTAQRDELRNKLQAFEFANKSAGDLLRDALATVKRQREFIRTLYTSRKARKSKGSTSGQKKAEVAPQVKCGASATALREVSESSPSFPIVMRLEFDDRTRTTCSACNQTTDVMK